MRRTYIIYLHTCVHTNACQGWQPSRAAPGPPPTLRHLVQTKDRAPEAETRKENDCLFSKTRKRLTLFITNFLKWKLLIFSRVVCELHCDIRQDSQPPPWWEHPQEPHILLWREQHQALSLGLAEYYLLGVDFDSKINQIQVTDILVFSQYFISLP